MYDFFLLQKKYLAIALVWFEPSCSSVPGVVCTNVMPPKSTLWTAVFVADLVDKFPIKDQTHSY